MEESTTGSDSKKHQRRQSEVESNTGRNYIPINPETGKRFTMQEAYGPARTFVEEDPLFEQREGIPISKTSKDSSAVATPNTGEGQPKGTSQFNEPREHDPPQFAPEDSEEHPSLEKEIRAAGPQVTDDATVQHARVVSEIEAVVPEVSPG